MHEGIVFNSTDNLSNLLTSDILVTFGKFEKKYNLTNSCFQTDLDDLGLLRSYYIVKY